MTRTRIALLAAALWPAVGLAVDPKADVPRLIEQLADPDYATREAATKKLCDLGAPALAALRTAAESSSPERAERAAALVARITRRIENEQALAPTVVDLPATEQTVREVFDAIEKQSRVQLRIDGDQAILTQKRTPVGGKKPFWEHVQDVAAKTGLTVSGVQSATDITRLARMDATEREEFVKRSHEVASLRQQMILLQRQIANATDAAEKAGLLERFEEVKARYATLTAPLKPSDPILGTITLLAAKPIPSCVCGAVRVEVTPPSADLLKRYTPGHLPLAVKVYAEPKLEWYRVTETAIFEATGPDGQLVAADSFTPKSFSTLANDELQFRRARLGLKDGETEFAPSTAGTAALVAPASGKPLMLKSVRGVVRGIVWTAPGEIVAVGLGEKREAAGASGHVNLRAKRIETDQYGLVVPKIEVTLVFDPSAVRPLNNRAATAVWLENGPGGRAVPVRANPPSARPTTDDYGLLLADADGRPLEVTGHSATTYQVYQDGRYKTAVSQKYVVRNTPANDGRAVATVSFHGTQQKQVEVPFRFTDVTLAPGTGDGQPLPEDYERVWKK